MKRFFLISSGILLNISIMTQQTFSMPLHTIKMHQYELLFSDFYSIQIKNSLTNENNFYRIINWKCSIKLKANNNLGVEDLFSPFLGYKNVGLVFGVLNGYILNIDKRVLENRARQKMRKRRTINVKVDVDESRKRVISNLYQSSTFTRIKIPKEDPKSKIKKILLWVDDIFSFYQVKILDIKNISDGIITDKKVQKIVDLKARTDGLLSHKSQIINTRSNLEKAINEAENQLKNFWNKLILKHKLYIAVFFNIPIKNIDKLLFTNNIKPEQFIKNINDNSNKYIKKLIEQ